MEQALTVVYRVLFLLFAEARGLVPTWHRRYRAAYSLDALVERTRSAKTRPLLMNGDPRAVLESLMTVRKPLYEEVADLKIETTGRTVRAVAADIRERLAAAS